MYDSLIDKLVPENWLDPSDLAAVMTFLAAGGPEDWHRVADGFNWDEGWAPLKWIVDRSDADKATIQTIFWDLNPWDIVERPETFEAATPEFLFMLLIMKRWRDGFYSRREISFPHSRESATDVVNHSNRIALFELACRTPGIEMPYDLVETFTGIDVEPGYEFFWRDDT